MTSFVVKVFMKSFIKFWKECLCHFKKSIESWLAIQRWIRLKTIQYY